MSESDTRDEVRKALESEGFVSLYRFSILAQVRYPTVLRYMRQGYLKTVRIGGVNRVYKEEAERFLSEGNAVNDDTRSAAIRGD